MENNKEKILSIVRLSRDEVGRSEENVKQKIVVPLLECLNHQRTQLDFEYGSGNKRIDIFIKDLPLDCKVIIDTKNYDEDLNDHLDQIGLYAFQEGALLAIIVNGQEIRIYDPFFRGFSFKDSILYSLKREQLKEDINLNILFNLLSRENLKTKKVKEYIIAREQQIMETYSKIEEIKAQFNDKKISLSEQKEMLIHKVDEIQTEIRKITDDINNIDSEKKSVINKILKEIGLPYIRETLQEISPSQVQEIRTQNVLSRFADKIEIRLNKIHTPRTWGLIPVAKDIRSFFPGYNVDFILQTDIGDRTVHVTSSATDTKLGDPEAGSYITGGLKDWYRKHHQLKDGDIIIIEVIEPKRKYRLSTM